MKRIFTEYLRLLDPRGEPPDADSFGSLLSALRTALKSELKKRGLWENQPSYLGIFGCKSWSAPDPSGDLSFGGVAVSHRSETALEELLFECYEFIFVTRLESLRAHLQVKPNIDGLVFLNIRHFLYDRQKAHDPIGLRIFEMVQGAVRQAVLEGELHVLAGDSKIRNDTLLGFAPDAGSATAADLPSLVVSWNPHLLPELITARGAAQRPVIARLRRHLSELSAAGIAAFRFRHLIDPLKSDARARWALMLERSQGELAFEDSDDELASVVRLVHPDSRVEERDNFEKLTVCVEESLGGLELNEKTRGYLFTLWQFLKSRAAKEHDLPSRRQIALRLSIPRDRLQGLYAILGRAIRQCQASLSKGPPVLPQEGYGSSRRQERST